MRVHTEAIDQLFYQLNQHYPNAMKIDSAMKLLNRDCCSDKTGQNKEQASKMDFIDTAEKYHWPIVVNEDYIRLNHPLYSKIGIQKVMNHAVDWPLLMYQQISSTNQFALNPDQTFESNTILLAYQQSGGVGRLGRQWQSPFGTSASLTFLLQDFNQNCQPSLLSHLTAWAFVQTLLDLGFLDIGIKWPNDVLIAGKKIAGILCQLDGNRIAVGIGLNLFQQKEDFPTDLQAKAASLFMQNGQEFNPNQLIGLFINHFIELYSEYYQTGDPKPFIDGYRDYSLLINRDVNLIQYNKPTRLVKVLDLLPTGELLIEDVSSGKHEKLLSQEISLRHPDGHYI